MSRRIALVTGGTRGIGFGIAAALGKSGFDLAVCGVRDADAARESVAALRAASGAEVLYVRADIGEQTDREALLAAVEERYGALHRAHRVLGHDRALHLFLRRHAQESFERLLRVNLQGPYFLTQAAANFMIRQKREDAAFAGAVVTVTSVSAEVASVNRGDYCVSKAGLAMAVKLFAARLGEFGIPVYEVRPGIIATDMTAGVTGKYDALIADGLLVEPRWGTPDDVGRAVAALARGDIPYATGTVLHVDGGLTLQRL